MLPARFPRRAPSRALPGTLVLGAALGLGGALAACGHTEPFTPPDAASSSPFEDTQPTRLTYNVGADLMPAWLPAGGGFFYSYERPGSETADRCLSRLPATGGTQRDVVCPRAAPDTTTIFGEPAVAPDGRLAFLRSRRLVFSKLTGERILMLAPARDARAATVLRTLPIPGPTGRQYTTLESLRWLDGHRLIAVGGTEQSVEPEPGAPTVLLPFGLDLLILDVDAPGSAPQVLPDVANPTSVTPGESADVIYYTQAADARVYRRSLADGTTTVAYDFGPAGVARDVHVAGGRLAVTVGGKIQLFPAAALGAAQLDEAGFLYVADLAGGTAERVGPALPGLTADLVLYRRPALAPSGNTIVAEAAPYRVRATESGIPDTSRAGGTDLWRLGEP
ncbi:MAG TPA: hypothetical protein VFS40_06655 [Gemmatimonadales bacterium]|nr:hypothetical protein [Gemmatimonadales bacterium]